MVRPVHQLPDPAAHARIVERLGHRRAGQPESLRLDRQPGERLTRTKPRLRTVVAGEEHHVLGPFVLGRGVLGALVRVRRARLEVADRDVRVPGPVRGRARDRAGGDALASDSRDGPDPVREFGPVPGSAASSRSAQETATARSSRSSGRTTWWVETAGSRTTAQSVSISSVERTPGRNGRRSVCRRSAAAASCCSRAYGGCRPSMRMRASRSGIAGSGSRSVLLRQPPAARPSAARYSAPPQDTDSPQPSRSVVASWRRRSAHSSSASGVSTNRQGWLLWIDGARMASATTASTSARDGRAPSVS